MAILLNLKHELQYIGYMIKTILSLKICNFLEVKLEACTNFLACIDTRFNVCFLTLDSMFASKF